MKGNFFLGAEKEQKFEIREMEFGELGAHEVLVDVQSCGICGTDVHIYHGEKGSAEVTPPVVLGHEFAGIVTAVGAEVEGLEVGDHVALDPNMYCGRCMPCRMGRKQNCEHLYALGVNTNGGFAQRCVCPDTQCFKLKKEIDFDVAAMTEPLACAIHGIDNAQIRSGQSVLVIGGGPIGLIMVQLAKLEGAGTIILSEPVESRRALGLELGADYDIDPLHENVTERIREILGEDGANVVIECVGKTFATEQALAAAGYSGRILLFSVPSVGATVQLPLFDVYKKELHIVGSMINPDTHQRAANLINSGKIELKKLITHVFPLADVEAAIFKQMDADSIKVVVHPQE